MRRHNPVAVCHSRCRSNNPTTIPSFGIFQSRRSPGGSFFSSNRQISCPVSLRAGHSLKTMPTSAHDGDLLRSWLDAGNEDAFQRLVARHAGLVRQCALRSSGDPATADEAAQLTFILLARKARQLQSRASLAGWLHTTARLQTRNLLRAQRREIRKRHAILAMNPPPHQEHSKVWREMAPVLDDALADLRPDDREAILLRFYRSLSHAEIASALGIAGDAARKRVDRAVERLRSQLHRRGCTLGTASCLGALAHFGTDAQAAATSAPILASHALKAAAAAAPTTLTTTTIAIIMTKKATIAATAVLLLAGAGAVVLINQDDSSKTNPADEANNGRPPRPAAATAAATGIDPTSTNNPRSRERDPAENPEFVTKYGEARTNLSKHVATNVIGLLEDAVTMSEMATSGQLGGFGGGRMGIRAGLGGVYNQLNLTEDQQSRAADLYSEFQKREIERSKASIEKLKQDPTALMQLMLASDAFKRGELTDEEYQALQSESGRDLVGIMNPLDRNNFRGGQPLGDEAFVSAFQQLLDAEQADTLQASIDQRAADSNGADPSNITNLPAMELEQLDRAVTSGKTITSGLKQMMEGMGGLQDLAPLLEQQQQQQQQQD
jgi:RNA polymerase sigma factor (sigma-70 family)